MISEAVDSLLNEGKWFFNYDYNHIKFHPHHPLLHRPMRYLWSSSVAAAAAVMGLMSHLRYFLYSSLIILLFQGQLRSRQTQTTLFLPLATESLPAFFSLWNEFPLLLKFYDDLPLLLQVWNLHFSWGQTQWLHPLLPVCCTRIICFRALN